MKKMSVFFCPEIRFNPFANDVIKCESNSSRNIEINSRAYVKIMKLLFNLFGRSLASWMNDVVPGSDRCVTIKVHQ